MFSFTRLGKKARTDSAQRENHRTLKYYNDCSASAPKLFTPKALYQIFVGATTRNVNNLFYAYLSKNWNLKKNVFFYYLQI